MKVVWKKIIFEVLDALSMIKDEVQSSIRKEEKQDWSDSEHGMAVGES